MYGNIFEDVYHMDWQEINRRFPLIAKGSSRFVYSIDKYHVVKIAINKDGKNQCKKEDQVYKNADEYMRRYLCPVAWYAPGMIAMHKAVPLIPLETFVNDAPIDPFRLGYDNNIFTDLRILSKKFGLLYEDLISITSWGFIGKIPVLIDYGCKG